MTIPANNEINFPRNRGFEKFIVFGIVLNKSDLFFRNNKLGELIDIAGNFVYSFLFQVELGTIEDFKIFADHIGCDNNREFLFVPLL